MPAYCKWNPGTLTNPYTWQQVPFWYEATVFHPNPSDPAFNVPRQGFYSVSSSSYTINASPLACTNSGGVGCVNGNVSNGVGLQNATVMVFSNPGYTPVAYAMTDANGNFSISNLPLGSYFLRVDYPGLYDTEQIITLNAGQPCLNGLNVPMSTSHLSEGLLANGSVRVYPNPTTGNATLQIPTELGAHLNVTSHDAMGRLIYTHSGTSPSNGEITLNSNDWAPGLYTIRVQVGNDRQTTRLVVTQQ
jgi:Carboxypeptidase regulatory-like domain/Secretion system C-terminal sorting domain